MHIDPCISHTTQDVVYKFRDMSLVNMSICHGLCCTRIRFNPVVKEQFRDLINLPASLQYSKPEIIILHTMVHFGVKIRPPFPNLLYKTKLLQIRYYPVTFSLKNSSGDPIVNHFSPQIDPHSNIRHLYDHSLLKY